MGEQLARLESKIRAAKADGAAAVAIPRGHRREPPIAKRTARRGGETRGRVRASSSIGDARQGRTGRRRGASRTRVVGPRGRSTRTPRAKSDGPLAASRPLAASPPSPRTASRRRVARARRPFAETTATARERDGRPSRATRIASRAERGRRPATRRRLTAFAARWRARRSNADARRRRARMRSRARHRAGPRRRARPRASRRAGEARRWEKNGAAAMRSGAKSARATRRCAAADLGARVRSHRGGGGGAGRLAREVRAECASRGGADAARRLAEASLETCRRSESAATQRRVVFGALLPDASRRRPGGTKRAASHTHRDSGGAAGVRRKWGSGTARGDARRAGGDGARVRSGVGASVRGALRGGIRETRGDGEIRGGVNGGASRDGGGGRARGRGARERDARARGGGGGARGVAARNDELTTMSRRCDAAENAIRRRGEESSTRSALEAQHARHLEQLAAERDSAAERLREAQTTPRASRVSPAGRRTPRRRRRRIYSPPRATPPKFADASSEAARRLRPSPNRASRR